MKGKTALMAGVAAIALALTAGSACAAKSNSDNTSNMPAPTATQSDARYDELAQRVDALEAELQESEVRAAADHDKVTSWKPLAGWWDNTSISGRMYWDITNISNTHNHVDDSANGASFDLKRFYLGIDHTFDPIFSANLTTDVTYIGANSVTQLFVKKAYLQAKLDDAFVVRIGSADLPWIPYAEDQYGYRYVENTVADRTKFGTSADWGLHILGKFANGLLSYQVSVISGAGYKKPIRTEGPDFEGRLSLDYQGFQLAVGGYSGHLGQTHATSPTVYHAANRFNALAAYKADGFRVGVEYFYADNWTQVTSSTTSHAYGVSPFASYQFDPQWSVFGRYDYVKPYSDVARRSFENNYYNVGITYSPAKIVDFALVYKHDAGDNGFFGDSNGTIGGTAFAAANDGAYDEIGVWGQVRW
jgi:hypothetical protein